MLLSVLPAPTHQVCDPAVRVGMDAVAESQCGPHGGHCWAQLGWFPWLEPGITNHGQTNPWMEEEEVSTIHPSGLLLPVTLTAGILS